MPILPFREFFQGKIARPTLQAEPFLTVQLKQMEIKEAVLAGCARPSSPPKKMVLSGLSYFSILIRF